MLPGLESGRRTQPDPPPESHLLEDIVPEHTQLALWFYVTISSKLDPVETVMYIAGNSFWYWGDKPERPVPHS
jgi:hypothetical protein